MDWIDDPQLDRSRVTAASARTLRERMRQCASMVYAATNAAATSKWMPWELGYFDGRKGQEAIAIMPLVEYEGQRLGQEYLDIYPQIEKPDWSSLSAPIVTKRMGPVTLQKSLSELVAARGGSSWRVR
ncbi:hypothetical protein ACFC3F_07195 [Microbacterium sp. NPDC055910]|uniref:hypothetical protein n=1 Tax=Microbacterium sp. NPDC055910 TaxID=3345659 RepID=UPI0035DA298E